MSCAHVTAEPVEVSTFGRAVLGGDQETIAHVCVDCLEALPANWGCEDCEWIAFLVWGRPTPIKTSGRPCPTHANNPQESRA